MNSDAERSLAMQLRWVRVGERIETEYRFDPVRRWRFDFAWPAVRVAVEVEGGAWSGGRHTRGGGFEADAEKYNEAVIAGWAVLRVTPGMIDDGRALDVIERLLEARRERSET